MQIAETMRQIHRRILHQSFPVPSLCCLPWQEHWASLWEVKKTSFQRTTEKEQTILVLNGSLHSAVCERMCNPSQDCNYVTLEFLLWNRHSIFKGKPKLLSSIFESNQKINGVTLHVLYWSSVILWSPFFPNDLFICFELRMRTRRSRVVARWECWSLRELTRVFVSACLHDSCTDCKLFPSEGQKLPAPVFHCMRYLACILWKAFLLR